jgi:hypothetical protein
VINAESDFEFSNVLFFGRDISEYVAMFNLDLPAMRGSTVLDCSSGPAAFARQAADLGITVTACDPMYERDPAELVSTVNDHCAAVSEKQERNRSLFHDELVPVSERRIAMEKFLEDFPYGKSNGRYVAGRLPELPFGDSEFDMTLCGNLLFIYSDTASGGMMESSPMDYAFHKSAVFELLRVTRGEDRIYPLQAPNVREHTYLHPLIEELSNAGFTTELQPVPQRDIIGAEHLLRICRSPKS